MNLKRAIELCQLPLDQSRSHLVKVDRYALIHLMADRVGNIAQLKTVERQNESMEETINGLRQIEKFVDEKHAVEFQIWLDEQKAKVSQDA